MIVYIIITWMGIVVAGDQEKEAPVWEINCNSFGE